MMVAEGAVVSVQVMSTVRTAVAFQGVFLIVKEKNVATMDAVEYAGSVGTERYARMGYV